MRPAELPERIHRLGRCPNPWTWPDWAYAHDDGTFGNRFDDPQGVYRVLYAATERKATFIECLATFRPDPVQFAEMKEIEEQPGDEQPPLYGEVPVEWLPKRCLGRGVLAGNYVDLGHHETLQELRDGLASRVVHHNLHDLDATAIRLSTPRGFTQDVSRYVFERTVSQRRMWDGIAYQSHFGDDWHLWALFEPTGPKEFGPNEDIDESDPDFLAALEFHALRLVQP